MKETTLTWINKSEWGDGPWQQESDRISWVHQATGNPCLIVRGPSGALCGYAGVTDDHPWFGEDFDEVEVDIDQVLNFSEYCQEDKERGVCHVSEPGQNNNVWWFGFDTVDRGLFCPAFSRFISSDDLERYKDVDYTRSQVQLLAAQLAEKNKALSITGLGIIKQ